MSAEARFPTVNQAAFCTTTLLAAGTAASAFAAATTAATVAMIAYSILAITGAAISVAAVSAWADPRSTHINAYFANCQIHAGYTISGFYQFVAQMLVQGLVQGAANGIAAAVRRRIVG